MKNYLFAIALYIVFLNGSFAQAPAIQWQKCFGGASFDAANSIIQTSDGGYLVAGTSLSTDGDVTNNNGVGDYWIVKLDPVGSIQWQKCLGGSGVDLSSSIIQTIDGGYAVLGTSSSSDGDVTGGSPAGWGWIVKLDPVGNIQWQRSFGGPGTVDVNSIIQTIDGGYMVAGASTCGIGNHGSHDYWIVKLSYLGILEWEKSLGGSGYDVASSIVHTFDGGYMIAGYSSSTDGDVTGNHAKENHGDPDYWIVKLNLLGILEWEKSLGGLLNDRAYSVIHTFDRGYTIAGYSNSKDGDVTGNHATGYNNGEPDYWIVKLAPDVINSIAEPVTINNIAVYPNPAEEEAIIHTGPEMAGEEYILSDCLGREVLKGQLESEKTILSVKELPVGIYTIRFGTCKRQTVKFMKR